MERPTGMNSWALADTERKQRAAHNGARDTSEQHAAGARDSARAHTQAHARTQTRHRHDSVTYIQREDTGRRKQSELLLGPLRCNTATWVSHSLAAASKRVARDGGTAAAPPAPTHSRLI